MKKLLVLLGLPLLFLISCKKNTDNHYNDPLSADSLSVDSLKSDSVTIYDNPPTIIDSVNFIGIDSLK